MKQTLACLGVAVTVAAAWAGAQQPARGVALADLTWADAEPVLTASSVVVIPLGAGAIEQGMHMKLNSDERLARHLASRVQAASSVVIAPALNYHFYPAYAEYPGSTSLSEASAQNMTADAVRSLARFGPRRFYVINTSPSTLAPLFAVAKSLADDGILLGYTDPEHWTKGASVLKQAPIGVGHAEEASTSMLLFVDPSAVDMTKARREYAAGRGALTRQEDGRGVVSKSGTLGDATLATPEKGRALVDALLTGILSDIETLRAAPLPAVKTAPAPAPAPSPRPAVAAAAAPGPRSARGCTAGDERAIRQVAEYFTYYWTQQDAISLAGLFTADADIRHPDGSIERGPQVIQANRAQLFTRREYRGSRHPVQINDVRCHNDVAIADGKWELRLAGTPETAPGRGMAATPTNAGWCTLIMVKAGDGWMIDAWRYTINPAEGVPAPVLLSKPGVVGRGGG